MSEEFLVSPDGYEKLKNELERLKSVEMPAIISAISKARGFGDLSENAEFSSAKERQGFIENRIMELESKLAKAKVVNPSEFKGNEVQFGATVKIMVDGKEERIYKILGSDEADLSMGILSSSSLVGKSIIGKKVGDKVNIKTPSGVEKCYEILSIKFV